ncbi:MAG TPA: LytTR family DNA-binding domain-containing protein [Segetibacter sp.]
MIQAIAIDDEPPALHVLSAFCSKIDFIALRKTFTNTETASHYLKDTLVDLLFLDINMPSISGLDFYKQLSKKLMVIFTTAYSEYAIEGFNVKAIDYLLKPFTFQRFTEAVEKANEYYTMQQAAKKAEPEYLVLRIDYKLVKIDTADITYIKGFDDYLKIYVRNQKPYMVRLTMKSILDKLPVNFLRVHRSYIVSFHHIQSVGNKVISIANEQVPIGNIYEEAFMKRFAK